VLVDPAGDVLDHAEGGAVGPVQVVHRQDHGPLPGQGDQDGESPRAHGSDVDRSVGGPEQGHGEGAALRVRKVCQGGVADRPEEIGQDAIGRLPLVGSRS
jgi:hypothetical protein